MSNDRQDKELITTIERAVAYAISKVGMNGLKRTSMFLSNVRTASDMKSAA